MWKLKMGYTSLFGNKATLDKNLQYEIEIFDRIFKFFKSPLKSNMSGLNSSLGQEIAQKPPKSQAPGATDGSKAASKAGLKLKSVEFSHSAF
jgi:hypothetical protein